MVRFCSRTEANTRSSYFHGIFQLSKQVHEHHCLFMLTATLWGRNSFFQCMEGESEGQSCEKPCPEPGKETAGDGTQLSWCQGQCSFTGHHTDWTTVGKWPKDARLRRVNGQVGSGRGKRVEELSLLVLPDSAPRSEPTRFHFRASSRASQRLRAFYKRWRDNRVPSTREALYLFF